jgi:DNA-binding response OmpR family regulator
MRILLIESDNATAGWLAPRLEAAGFVVDTCDAIGAALSSGLHNNVAALVIEIGDDCLDSRIAAETVRSAGIVSPLVLIGGRSDWRETVASLDAGADEYIVKPVRSGEVVSRIRTEIQRSKGAATNRITIGRFEIDLNARCAWLDDRPLVLTKSEFRLLRLLLLNQSNFMASEEIRAELTARGQPGTCNAIEVLLARLRKKLGSSAVITARNLGYRINPAYLSKQPCDNSPDRSRTRNDDQSYGLSIRQGEPRYYGSGDVVKGPLL